MTAEVEHRLAAPPELRLAGRRLEGVALKYGVPARDRRELFVAGAFAPLPDAVPVNLQHDPALELGAAELADSDLELRMAVLLGEGSGVYRLVQRGALAGLSVEFVALQEDRVAGARRILKAELRGLAVVDEGAYDTRVEARSRAGRRRVWL